MNRITADEARDLLLAVPCAPRVETVPLAACAGRVLAEDLSARYDVPPFDRSPFDGYAFRGADTLGASRERPAVLQIVEEIPAGKVPEHAVGPGQAAKILTGGPIPAGADATIKYEATEFTAGQVRLFESCKPGSNLARAGEDVARGALLGRRGTVVAPALAGLFAGQGWTEIPVFAKPRIAVFSTGSELLEPGEPAAPGKVYNSNTTAVCAHLAAAGAIPAPGGNVPDDLAAITARLDEALRTHDMVVTTGGASVGDYDWAKRACEALGASVLFWKCAMKPGGSQVAAVRDGKLLLALSGNPGAAVLGLLKIGLPAVRRLCGRADCLPEPFSAFLSRDYPKASPMFRLLRGRLRTEEGRLLFAPAYADGNGVLSSLRDCDALAEIPAGSSPLPAGTLVRGFLV